MLLFVGTLRVGAGRQQQPHHLHVGRSAGEEKRRRANDVRVPAGKSRWTLRHRRVRIGAASEQRLHELQLRLSLGNAAHRVGETEHRIRFAALPGAHRPMQRRHAGIARIRIGAALEEEQRERHLRSHRRHEQRRAAGRHGRLVARAATASAALAAPPAGSDAPLPPGFSTAAGCDRMLMSDAGGQQQPRRRRDRLRAPRNAAH